MPSLELFLSQPVEIRQSVLPEACTRRLSIEAGVTMGWQGLIGDRGIALGIDRFGESAPANVLAEHFGFTTANVLKHARQLLSH